MKFGDRTSAYIINPSVGTEFDNCDEAYEYYNLYSWECGTTCILGSVGLASAGGRRGGLRRGVKEKHLVHLHTSWDRNSTAAVA